MLGHWNSSHRSVRAIGRCCEWVSLAPKFGALDLGDTAFTADGVVVVVVEQGVPALRGASATRADVHRHVAQDTNVSAAVSRAR
jgi:hypothetical protein